MTIASEISRLQTAKACLKASIENKGITVGSDLSLSNYYACVDAISSGPKNGYIDVLIVGGGGAGGYPDNYRGGGGGGAGGYVYCCMKPLVSCEDYEFTVTVGSGGATYGCNGGDSCFGSSVAYGGGGGANAMQQCGGKNGGSGGGGSAGYAAGKIPGNGCAGQGNKGGCSVCDGANGNAGGGGGGACTAGCDTYCCNGGNGGNGCQNNMLGVNRYFSGGGGGGAWCGTPGSGGNGGANAGTDASCFGGGGGGANSYQKPNCCFGKGYQGIVVVRYKTDGSCGISTNSYGGCKYTCGDYTIHCFTDTSTPSCFIPVFK